MDIELNGYCWTALFTSDGINHMRINDQLLCAFCHFICIIWSIGEKLKAIDDTVSIKLVN